MAIGKILPRSPNEANYLIVEDNITAATAAGANATTTLPQSAGPTAGLPVAIQGHVVASGATPGTRVWTAVPLQLVSYDENTGIITYKNNSASSATGLRVQILFAVTGV